MEELLKPMEKFTKKIFKLIGGEIFPWKFIVKSLKEFLDEFLNAFCGRIPREFAGLSDRTLEEFLWDFSEESLEKSVEKYGKESLRNP